MATKTVDTRYSVCGECHGPLEISIVVGEQRWSDVGWEHAEPKPPVKHPAVPELRFAIDATCPGCGFFEIGYSPDRSVFVCSRCRHTQTHRPKD